jgi:hypothetical protein
MQPYVLGHLASTPSFRVLFKVVPETPRNALKLVPAGLFKSQLNTLGETDERRLINANDTFTNKSSANTLRYPRLTQQKPGAVALDLRDPLDQRQRTVQAKRAR